MGRGGPDRKQEGREERVGKGRKGFGYGVRCGAGPGNAATMELLPEEQCVAAVLDFLRATKVGMVKEGAIAS